MPATTQPKRIKQTVIGEFEYRNGAIYQISHTGRIRPVYGWGLNSARTYGRWFNFSRLVRANSFRTAFRIAAAKALKEHGFEVDENTGYVYKEPTSVIAQRGQISLFRETPEPEVYSPAEVRFKEAVKAIVARGEYPGALGLDKELKRYHRRMIKGNLNGMELQWRREVCRDIGFKLKGQNYSK